MTDSLQNGRLNVLLLNAVLLGIAGEEEGQSAVAGDVAGTMIKMGKNGVRGLK